MRNPALITLTTDFGQRDPYVAAMKGVLYSRCPAASVVDLSHDIPPGNIFETALFAAASIPYFPSETIHIFVVDPGVGTRRKALLARTLDQFVVCPDNGVLTFLLESNDVEWAREIANPTFMSDTVSPTFHGRDVFAPAAAAVANGNAPHQFGDVSAHPKRLDIPLSESNDDGSVVGEIIHIDRFGNCITNIRRDDLTLLENPAIESGELRITSISTTYGDAPTGEALALIGSAGYLEIAINSGNAREQLGLTCGIPIAVRNAAP